MDIVRQAASTIRGKDKSQDHVDSQRRPQEAAPVTSVLSPLLGYFDACRDVKSVEEWMRINQQQTGSQILYADEIGTGALVGYAAGFALRRAVKIGAVVVGVGFLTLQTLSYYDLLTVNWRKMDEVVRFPLDANADGKFDQEDISIMRQRLVKMLCKGLPSTTGFSAGLALGFLRG